MPFCAQCGQEVEEGKSICTECAAEKNRPAASPVPQVQPCPAQPAAPPQKPVCAAQSRDMRLAAWLMLPCILLANCLFWCGLGAGVTLSSLCITAIAFWYMRGKKGRPSAYTVCCTVLLVLLSLALSFSDEGATKMLAVATILLLYTIILTDTAGLRRFQAGSYRSVTDLLHTAFTFGIGKIGVGASALLCKQESGGNTTRRRTGKVLSGIVIALPVLILVVALLTASDAAFEAMLRKFTFASMWEILLSVLLGGFLFLILFSQLFSVKTAKVTPGQARASKGVDTVTLCSFLGVLSAAYLLYLISQLAYFFNGFAGLLPEDYTMAAYARRGFFEMCAVCAINLMILFIITLICRRKNGAIPTPLKAFFLFFSGFSLVLIATALSKMALYIDRFGMTKLRIFTSVFMIFLAVVFITLILRLFIRKIPYMQVVLLCACTILLTVCLADADRIVAVYNVDAYLNGSLQTVDVDTLDHLDAAAVEPLLKLYRQGDAQTSARARESLNRRLNAYFTIQTDRDGHPTITETDFRLRSFNLTEYTALQSLEENLEEIFDKELFSNQYQPF